MAETDLKVTVSLVDQITGKLKGVQDNLKGFSDNAKKVGTAFTGAGIAIGAAIGTSIKVASDFQSTMSNVSTLISGDSTEAIQGLSDGILEMTGRVPKSADELGAALYDVLSAGVQGSAEQLNVLEQSSKLAVAGLGDTKGAVGIMTSAINAFNLPAEDAGKISDILFKTVKNGKTTVDEMAQAFGASAPIVAAAGISLEEFSAATAALTTTGMPAAQAQNGLRQSVIALSKPTADMSKIFDELGFESGQAAIEQFGLVEVMKKVDEAADGNTETLGKAYGSVEAMGAAISLTGPTAEAFTNTLADMTDGANAVDEAFQKQTETFDSQMALLKNQFMGILITIGSELLPTITEAIKPLRENIGKWFEENKELAVTLAKVVAVIGAALLVLGPLLLALSALPALISGVGAAFTLATGPVGIITAAIALLIAGGILLYQNWDTIKEKIMAFLDKHPALMEALETAKETIKKVAEIIKEQFIKSWDKLMEALEPHKEELELIAKVLGGALLIALGTVALSIAALVLGISALILIGTTLVTWILEAGTAFENFKSKAIDAVGNAFSSIGSTLAGFIETVRNVFASIPDTVNFYIEQMRFTIDNAIDNIKNKFWALPDAISGAFSSISDKAKNMLPNFDIPGFAGGVNNFSGGLAVVGERGPELVNLPRGSSVIPNSQISNNNAKTFNITVNEAQVQSDWMAQMDVMLRTL